MILKSGITRSDFLLPRTFPQPSLGQSQGLGKQLCSSCPAHLQRVSFTQTACSTWWPWIILSADRHSLFPRLLPLPDTIPQFIVVITLSYSLPFLAPYPLLRAHLVVPITKLLPFSSKATLFCPALWHRSWTLQATFLLCLPTASG